MVRFLGHIIDGSGIRADPQKTKVIKDFPEPKNITELQKFMDVINQMGKFLQYLAMINEPLRQLLKNDKAWCWSEAQQEVFDKSKQKLLSSEVLAHYDPKLPTITAAD
ncbi:uncharacterized protein [Heterodontus francisci]|uniref:uncharacterized protein n=1 Tax=Heterodontus francisci TaxID=7792 RepID=UPI00355C3E7F